MIATGVITINQIIGKKIIWLPETTSTNDIAKIHAQQGAPEGLVIAAERQTNGRGRHQKAWVSQPGGLYFSIILRPAIPVERLATITLLVGISVADVLYKAYQLPVRLKWPNDILLYGKKLAGILTEASSAGMNVNYVIVGIGVNTNQDRHAWPEEIRSIAITLQEAIIQKVNNQQLLQQILSQLNHYYHLLLNDQLQIVNTFKRYDVTLGRDVIVTTQCEQFTAKALDISSDGALIVQKPDGTQQKLWAGDISLGRYYHES